MYPALFGTEFILQLQPSKTNHERRISHQAGRSSCDHSTILGICDQYSGPAGLLGGVECRTNIIQLCQPLVTKLEHQHSHGVRHS